MARKGIRPCLVCRDIRSVKIKRIDKETERFCVDCVWRVFDRNADTGFDGAGDGGFLRRGTVAWIDRRTFEVSVRTGFEDVCDNNDLIRMAIMEKCVDVRSSFFENVFYGEAEYTSLVVCYCLMALSVTLGLVFYYCGDIKWCTLSMLSVFFELSLHLLFVAVYGLLSDFKRGKMEW